MPMWTIERESMHVQLARELMPQLIESRAKHPSFEQLRIVMGISANIHSKTSSLSREAVSTVLPVWWMKQVVQMQ